MARNLAFSSPVTASGEWLEGGRLERAKGFEPSTPTLARLCSTPELRPRSIEGRLIVGFGSDCKPGNARFGRCHRLSPDSRGATLLLTFSFNTARRTAAARPMHREPTLDAGRAGRHGWIEPRHRLSPGQCGVFIPAQTSDRREARHHGYDYRPRLLP